MSMSFPVATGRLTHVQLLLAWNLSPLQSSRISLEYLLLPPRSALEAVSPSITAKASSQDLHACLLVGASQQRRRRGMGVTLERHPFSGLVHSAGELLRHSLADSDFHGHRPAV